MNVCDQRYISEELSHFVGRGKSEKDQYDILVNRILKTGWLTHPPHNPNIMRSLSLDLSKPISTDNALIYQVVCFCDIPIPDLKMHTNKYSKFGLSFKKLFLIDKGACPVFYVSNESPVQIRELLPPGDFRARAEQARNNGFFDRALYFDILFRYVIDILAALDSLTCDEGKEYFKDLNVADFRNRLSTLVGLTEAQISTLGTVLKGNEQSKKMVQTITDFLLNHVFTYFKCFDSKRDLNDELNYYTEREWRIDRNINFQLTDVSRVFFPQKYASQFRADLPEYLGQITFLD